jgi:hypothetical protein
MRALLAITALLVVSTPAIAQQSAGSPPPAQAAQPAIPDPPFNVYINTFNEKGTRHLVVMYQADHTYTLTTRSNAAYTMGGKAARVTMERDLQAGRWWIDGRKFCWTQERGANPETRCKSNGHYIGRTPIPGFVAQPQPGQ